MTEKLRKAMLDQTRASDKLRSLDASATAETRTTAEAEFNAAASAVQTVLVDLGEPFEPPSNGDAESVELRRLLDGASLGLFFEAAAEHRIIGDGREAELQQHFGLGQNQFPIEMLREPEERALTVAPAAVGAAQRPIVQPIFSQGDAAYLNVAMPIVDSGDQIFPVLTTKPTVAGPFKDSTSVGETTGVFSSDSISPGRLQTSFYWKRTDGIRFIGMMEALRAATLSGLSEALDVQVLAQIVSDVARTDASSADDFDSYRKRFLYDLVDGKFAVGEGSLKLLLAPETLQDASQLFRSATGDVSVIDSLRRICGGVKVSPHIVAAASAKQDVIVRRGSRPDAVACTWRSISLIPDEISRAKTGEIVLSAVLLAGFKIVRTGGFARVQAQFA